MHLTTTDPAAHLKFVLEQADNVTMSHIDEHTELKKYQEKCCPRQGDNGLSGEDIAYIEEDLRSPCTQEIAVFRAFAEIVEKADDQIVVIDTAPTGHTLLLLESTESYDKEIQRTKGETPESVRRLLPRLKSEETEVVIVTLPEATRFMRPCGWRMISSGRRLRRTGGSSISPSIRREVPTPCWKQKLMQ